MFIVEDSVTFKHACRIRICGHRPITNYKENIKYRFIQNADPELERQMNVSGTSALLFRNCSYPKIFKFRQNRSLRQQS